MLKKPSKFLLRVCLGMLFLAAFPLLSADAVMAAKKAAKAASPSFFSSEEVESNNLKPFKKWTSALARYSKEAAEKKKGDCKASKLNKCHFEQWMKFLAGIKGKDPMTQVNEVNRVMNKAKYITDKNNWGKKDYWATPGEFMAKFGDCEDYAISKYMSLKFLGFKMEQLRVVAVKPICRARAAMDCSIASRSTNRRSHDSIKQW